MNMSAIAAVQPSTLAPNSDARGAGHSEHGSGAKGFLNVLTRQQGSEAETAAVQAPDKKTEDKPGKAGAQANELAAADEAQARASSEQAMALPQIALHIAAEVAAVKQTSSVGSKLLADQAGASLIQESPAVGTAGKTFATRSTTPLASLLSNAIDNTAAKPTGTDGALASALSATPAIEAAGGRQTIAATSSLIARHAAGVSGAKQALLATQARMQAGEASPDAIALANFLASQTSAASTGETGTLALHMGLPNAQPTASHGFLSEGMALGVASGAILPGSSSAAAPGHTLAVATPLGSPNWSADFSRQFVSIAQGANNMPHTAELRLDPPELGPLRISININDSTATAVFVSPHATVRQTVENALPQLQQQLAQAGISLGQTSVSDHGQSDQPAYSSSSSTQGGAGRSSAAAAASDIGAARAVARSMASNALVDTFA